MEILDKAEKVRQEWNAWVPPEFFVEEQFLEWNILRQSWLDYFVEEVHQVPCVFAVASQKGLQRGINEKSLWLSLYGEIQSPKDFLSSLLEFAKNKRKSRIQFGGEDFHFVSGIPRIEKCEGLLNSLSDFSFKTADVVDYSGEVFSPSIETFVKKHTKRAKENSLYFKKVESEEEFKKMELYLSEEFPGRWTREFIYYSELRQKAANLAWFFFYDEQKNILGFSRLGKARDLTDKQIWFPGALRLPYVNGQEKKMPDSCLGPIGITKSFRGKGLGNILLALTLENLMRVNAELLCIDWTDAYNYYKPLGLEEVRRIRNAFINLG